MDDLPGQNSGGDTGAPRWVKVFGIIAIVLALIVVVVHLAGGGLGGHVHTP